MSVFDREVYKGRREKLKASMGSGQILLLGNVESSVNFKDNWYPFRQDSTLLYYTGIDIPGIHLIIDVDLGTETIYGDELTIDDVVWTGPLPSLSEIANKAGIETVKATAHLSKDVKPSQCSYLPPYRPEQTLLLADLLGKNIQDVTLNADKKLIKAIIAQRNIKEAREIAEMDEAVKFTYDMHLAVMKHARAGQYESDLVGIASSIAYKHQVGFAYPAILTKRGEVLHNHDHHGLLENGDMVLYDGGCESRSHYAGDITRTFPIGGKWQPLQKDLYDVVYDSYKQSVEAMRLGIAFKDVHLLACKVLCKGLKDLGFMKGDVDDAVANGAHTMFFQCGLGHMIGLDVHDMENLGEPLVGYSDKIVKSTEFGLKSLRLGRELKEGYAVTIEPGIYIIPSLIELRKSQGLYKDFINYDLLEKHASFGGIRLEDDFVITADGYKMIGDDIDIPRTSDEISAYMQQFS